VIQLGRDLWQTLDQARRLSVLIAMAALMVALLPSSARATTNESLEGLAVLDSFGTNESPLSGGGSWSALSWANGTSGHNTGRVSGGWGPNDAYPTINGAYWNKTTFADEGPGTAVAATLTAKPANLSRYFSLWLDMPKPGSERSGYELRFTEVSSEGYEVVLARWKSGTKTVLDSEAVYSLETGRQLALVDKAGVVTAWVNPTSEEYVQLLSASDSTFSSGYSGIEGAGNLTRLKGFKSGLFAPRAPTNITLPVISPSTPTQGESETATNGTWTEKPTSFHYQWKRCNGAGGECAKIAGAESFSYTPVEADVKHTLIIDVTAENLSGSTVASSKPTSEVAAVPVEKTFWKVNGAAISGTLKPEVQVTELETLAATGVKESILLTKVGLSKVELLCTELKFVDALLGLAGSVTGKIHFAGCVMKLNGGAAAGACKPHSPGATEGLIQTNALKGLIVLHTTGTGAKEELLELNPESGAVFVDIKMGKEVGSECSIGSAFDITGKAVLKAGTTTEGKEDTVSKLFSEGPLSVILFGGGNATTLDGGFKAALTGSHAGMKWSGIAG